MGGGMGQLVFINSYSWNCIFGTKYGAEIGKALLPRLAQQHPAWAKKQNFCSGTAKIGGQQTETVLTLSRGRSGNAVMCGSHPSSIKNDDGHLSSKVTSFFPTVHILEVVDYRNYRVSSSSLLLLPLRLEFKPWEKH